MRGTVGLHVLEVTITGDSAVASRSQSEFLVGHRRREKFTKESHVLQRAPALRWPSALPRRPSTTRSAATLPRPCCSRASARAGARDPASGSRACRSAALDPARGAAACGCPCAHLLSFAFSRASVGADDPCR